MSDFDGIARFERVEYGVDNDSYRRAPGLSHSDSKRLRKTPRHYHAVLNSPVPSAKPTPAMFAGTLAHCALLEPEAFYLRYIIAPEVSKNSNAYKEFAARCIGDGIEPITEVQHDVAFAQAASLRTLPDVLQMMSSGMSEVSAWWRDPATQVLCKCRPDRVFHAKRGVLLLDVKTTSDASPEGFSKSVANFGYHTQADWYSQGYALASGLDVEGFVFAVVESEFPYACATYMLDERALACGRFENAEARALFKQCSDADEWPGYTSGVEISLPPWYAGLRRMEQHA